MADIDRIRVLIVENESLEGYDLSSTLETMGYKVVSVCRSGEEAISLTDDLQPDVVLMDVHLSGELDGIETAHLLARHGEVAVIYLTACVDDETVSRAKDTHPCGYLLKPCNEAELRASLEMAAARHRAELHRRGREQSFADVFQSLCDGIIVADVSGHILFLNPAAEKLLGWTCAEAVKRSLGEIYSIHSLNGENTPLIPAYDRHRAAEARPLLLTTKDGRRVAIEDRISTIKDARGSLSGVTILFKETVVPKQTPAEEPVPADLLEADDSDEYPEEAANAVTTSTAPLVDIVESISDPLMALDGRWRFTYANSSATKLFNRDKRALMGQSLWDVLPPSAHQSHFESLSRALLYRETVTREIFLEESGVWFEARTYPFGSGLLFLLKDITSRKLEAERISRLDRLESLGLLARGFAHDFNNLLTVLLGNLSLAEMRFGHQADKVMELLTAKQATLQAQSLVQQLLTFARGGAPIKRLVSLPSLVKNFFHNHPRVGHVNYFVEVQEDLPLVAIDPNQIRRFLGNLIRNAEQATVHGGDVHVRCEAADADTMFPNENLPETQNKFAGVILEVSDNGEGISSPNLNRIFEPYFSTRKAENATGLGLTVCESIAKAHGGSISVYSQPGKGTSIRFFLPVDEENEQADPPAALTESGTAPDLFTRILVLEDDNLVRSLIVRGLQSQNFEVTETVDGNDTVRLYQQAMQEGRPYDIVILDLSIPNGMGGLRTMEKLRSLDPSILALVSSGYSDDPVMAQPDVYGFAAVLPKPYEPGELIELVKNLLSKRVRPQT